MKNLGQLMKQAQQMQSRMEELQEALAAAEITGSAGAGMVTVTMNGKNEVKAVKIDPSMAGGADDVEILEDLLAAAFNDAKAKVEAKTQEEMQKITGGLNLPPGMKLPF